MIFEARSSLRRWISVTWVAKRVRKSASSSAVSPPPTTAIGLPRKSAPSQVAQAETPLFWRRVSDVEAQPLGRGAHREDQGVRLEAALRGLDPERPLRDVDPGGVLEPALGAEALGLLLEHLHHLRPGHAVREARIVLDVGREHQLTAELQPRDHDRLELGARRVDRRRVARRPAADDHHPVPLAPARSPRLALEQRIELSARVERGQIVEAADVPIADEDLGDRPAPRALDHLLAPLRLGLDVDLGPGLPLLGEQALGHRAVGTGLLRVHDDRNHRRPPGP